MIFLPIIFIVLIVALVFVLVMLSYVKAPPDKAYVISGLRRRVIIGRAGFKIPFLERVDILDLKLMSVDVKSNESVPTNNFIDVFVDGVVKVKIGSDDNAIRLASENFLNQGTNYIIEQVTDVLEGNMREIIGSLDLREMMTDRKMFSEKVQENAVPDLKRMGLEIISFNIQSFTDKNNVIEDLGIENISQIQKSAKIAKANAEKEVAIAQSEAEKISNDARIKAELEISQKNTDLENKKSELKKNSDMIKAQADAAYEIEKEEQRKVIVRKSQEANIIKQEKEVELAEREAQVQEQRLNAEIKKSADADLYRRKQQAEAELFEKQKEAEANLYVIEKESLANRTEAEAKRFAEEQQAKAIQAKGLAEADAIKAKLLAEADGIDAKAEAMKKYGEAAIMEMYFKALPEIAKNVATPLNNVDKITMYGDGNSAKMTKDIINTMSQITNGITESTGIDLQSLISGFVGGKFAIPTTEITVKDDILHSLANSVTKSPDEPVAVSTQADMKPDIVEIKQED